jgi:uncharacterized protein (UPF0335 family)
MSDLYDRAVALAKQRTSLSATNLKTALGVSDAQAKTFIRIMREDGILGAADNVLGRYPVVAPSRASYGDQALVVDLDHPERSVVAGVVTPDEILDAEAQGQLRGIMDALIGFEARQAQINDERRIVMEMARSRNLSPKVLKKLASTLFRDKKAELLNGIRLTELYLHALGELIDDEAPAETGESVH